MGMDREQLNQISVASPCAEPWDTMRGDDQVRHCDRCDKNVYNISVMRLEDIAELVERKEGRMCVRFFRRTDGTILTDDCPVGVRAAVRRKLALAAAFIASIGAWMSTTFGRTCGGGIPRAPVSPYESPKPVRTVPSPSPSSQCKSNEGQWVAGGMMPLPPAENPVDFKVKGIAGNDREHLATIEYAGQTYVVKKDQRVPELAPAFEVKEISATKVTVFDLKIHRLVVKQLITE